MSFSCEVCSFYIDFLCFCMYILSVVSRGRCVSNVVKLLKVNYENDAREDWFVSIVFDYALFMSKN